MSVYRCVQPFSYSDDDGTPVVVGLGDLMSSGNAEFAKRAVFFEPVMVEDASAEPGKLRSLTSPRRGRPPKAAETEPVPEPEPTPEPVPVPVAEEK